MIQNSTLPTFQRITNKVDCISRPSIEPVRVLSYEGTVSVLVSPTGGETMTGLCVVHLCFTAICRAVWHIVSCKWTQKDRLRVFHNTCLSLASELNSIRYIISHVTSARWLVRPDASARWWKPPGCGWFQWNFPLWNVITSKSLTLKMWLPLKMVGFY